MLQNKISIFLRIGGFSSKCVKGTWQRGGFSGVFAEIGSA
jgi:hypothetical protein